MTPCNNDYYEDACCFINIKDKPFTIGWFGLNPKEFVFQIYLSGFNHPIRYMPRTVKNASNRYKKAQDFWAYSTLASDLSSLTVHIKAHNKNNERSVAKGIVALPDSKNTDTWELIINNVQ